MGSSVYAQYTPESQNKPVRKFITNLLNEERPESGHFNIPLRQQKQYHSQPSQIPLRLMDVSKAQTSLQGFQKSLETIRPQWISPNLPNASLQQISTETALKLVESAIDKEAIIELVYEKFSQFEGLANEWQPHLAYVEQMINHYPNSIIDFQAMAQQLLVYAQQNNLLGLLQQDATALQQIDWSDFSLETFINEEGLEGMLNYTANQYNLAVVDTQAFLNQTSDNLEQSFHQNLNGTLSSLNHGGFYIQGEKIYYRESAQDMISLDTSSLTNSNVSVNLSAGQNVTGTVDITLGNFLNAHGDLTLNTQTLSQGLEAEGQHVVDQVVSLLASASQGQLNVTQLENLLNQLDGIFQNVQSNAISTILDQAGQSTETDYAITINLQGISDAVTATGKYQFADILLQVAGHDLGSVTITKSQILYISKMIAQGDETGVQEFVLGDILGLHVERIGYNVMADVGNNTLGQHNSGKLVPSIMAIDGPGGAIRAGQAFYFAARLKEWKGGSLALTGTYNERSITNTPLIKDDGWLHARVEIETSSLGLVYIPRIWKNDKAKIRVDGMVFVECLFVHAKYAGVLTKDNKGDVYELYRVNLGDIEGANKTYPVPNVAIAFNIQKEVLPGVCVSLNLLCQPYFAPGGNMNEIPKSIKPFVQPSLSMTYNIFQGSGKRKKLKPPTGY